ncbi:MAG: hypothetical protein IJZ19_07020 [Lentisphaeria bacterium]|nr:hypothetical protein [Lentisphaeria bacterium]
MCIDLLFARTFLPGDRIRIGGDLQIYFDRRNWRIGGGAAMPPLPARLTLSGSPELPPVAG